MTPLRQTSPELDALVRLFYSHVDELGTFQEVTADNLDPVHRKLLDHEHHMTVTVEAHHGCPVELETLQVHNTATHYARKIRLLRRTDHQVVQFGIVRLSLDFLEADVRTQIESQQIPLGRILIEHNVLRDVRLLSHWRILPGKDLQSMFDIAGSQPCFGRTAFIYCNSVPAVELLEIVAPE